jgi:hypothetical protein
VGRVRAALRLTGSKRFLPRYSVVALRMGEKSPTSRFHSGNTGSNHIADGSTFESVYPVFTRTRHLRARRDTVKTEATAAEKDWHRNYAKASNGFRDAPSFYECQFSAPALFTRSCCLYRTKTCPPSPRSRPNIELSPTTSKALTQPPKTC